MYERCSRWTSDRPGSVSRGLTCATHGKVGAGSDWRGDERRICCQGGKGVMVGGEGRGDLNGELWVWRHGTTRDGGTTRARDGGVGGVDAGRRVEDTGAADRLAAVRGVCEYV